LSGFAAIAHTGGAPVDAALLHRLADSLAFRGPDGIGVHISGPAGLVHALLRISPEPRQEQPCTLDGAVWIVADARLDDRETLIRALRSAGRDAPDDSPDPELVLHAYAVWGEECVGRLTGDFAFAIWDGPVGRLFCARDRFGVRPLFYAEAGGTLVASNTLATARGHPAVSATLDDRFVGDFLLFGFSLDLTATVYRDIRRVPPAHTLTWQDGRVSVRRYWTLPTDGVIRFRSGQEYVERFLELFRAAIADRTRAPAVAMFQTGGLDSASVAAAARESMPDAAELRAFTTVFDEIMPDRERHYSGLVARHLGMPIAYTSVDALTYYRDLAAPAIRTPEPADDPLAGVHARQFIAISRESRVALTGQGGDPALSPTADYFLNLLRRCSVGRFAREVAGYRAEYGRIPPLYLRARFIGWLTRRPRWTTPYPAWLEPGFAERLSLRDRWAQYVAPPSAAHPVRPDAYFKLSLPFWPHLFESMDAGATGTPLEVRHPFFDQRLVDFLLAIPPVPYCADKAILRTAMKGLLPDEIRCRPKTPLVANPLAALLRLGSGGGTVNGGLSHRLAPYVRRDAVPPVVCGDPAADYSGAWLHLRPKHLSDWLGSES